MLRLIKSKIALAIFFIGFSDISSLKSFIDIENTPSDQHGITLCALPLEFTSIISIRSIQNGQYGITFCSAPLKFITTDDVREVEMREATINTIGEIKNKLAFDEHNVSNPNFYFEEYVSLDNLQFHYVNHNLQSLACNIIREIHHELRNYSDKSVSENEFDNIFQKKCYEEIPFFFCGIFDSMKVEKLLIKKKKTVSAAQKLTPEEQKNLKLTYQQNELGFTKSKYIQAQKTAIDTINYLIGIKEHFATQVDGLGRVSKKQKGQIKNDINNIINLMIESRYPDLKGKSLDNKKAYLINTIAEYRFTNENDVSEYQEAIQYEIDLSKAIKKLHDEINDTIINKYSVLR